MKQVTMKETRPGSRDGTETDEFLKDETYTLPDSLADVFIAEGWAKEVKPAKPPRKKKKAAPAA